MSATSQIMRLLFSRKSSINQFTFLSVLLTGGHWNIINTLQTAAELENHSITHVHETVCSPKTTFNILNLL
jgi:ABC-type Na+ efflux pump permease subunit